MLLVGRGGVKGRKNCEQKFCERNGVSYYSQETRMGFRNPRVIKFHGGLGFNERPRTHPIWTHPLIAGLG